MEKFLLVQKTLKKNLPYTNVLDAPYNGSYVREYGYLRSIISEVVRCFYLIYGDLYGILFGSPFYIDTMP